MNQRLLPAVLGVLVLSLAGIGSGSDVQAQQRERPATVDGKPNLNGIWQARNTANWNLEAHPAEAIDEFWMLGSLAAIPAGRSVVVGGNIPYRPEALAQRDENRAGWPAADPETKCYMPGIPRAAYMPYPFQIVQGEGDHMLFSYTFANANRVVYMNEADHVIAPVDTWMGQSNGSWDGDTLVIEVNSLLADPWFDRAGNYHSNQVRVTERYSLIAPDIIQYEATIVDPETFTESWTIRMPLYRHIEEDARLFDFHCVAYAEQLLYGDLETGGPPPTE